jgi:glycosyltransferase involved in cell wall biosynthesis
VLGDMVSGPIIVDYDDLEHEKILQRLELHRNGKRSPWGVPINAAREYIQRHNAKCWINTYHRIGNEVERVVVCSEIDRERLGLPNAFVIPNGYALNQVKQNRLQSYCPDRVLMQGSFTYAPNIDGARWLVENVWPLIKAQIPSCELRIAGRAGEEVKRLGQTDGVTVTGFVEDMITEVSRAAVVAVPIRYGSGTRIKILEALAHGVPVVSTSLGAEGLGTVNGKHLLVADTPEEFAKSCMLLLRDHRLRSKLIGHGQRLVRESFDWRNIRCTVHDVALDVMGAAE